MRTHKIEDGSLVTDQGIYRLQDFSGFELRGQSLLTRGGSILAAGLLSLGGIAIMLKSFAGMFGGPVIGICALVGAVFVAWLLAASRQYRVVGIRSGSERVLATFKSTVPTDNKGAEEAAKTLLDDIRSALR